MTIPRPALDPELSALLGEIPFVPEVTPEVLAGLRAVASAPVETALEGRAVVRQETTAAAADGTRIPLSVFRPQDAAQESGVGVYWVHGGGMIMGDRYSNIDVALDWVERFGAVVVSVDYRLAPETSGTVLVEDCYSGLTWLGDHASELGIDPARIVVAGISAGGGLAAGVTLMARDRQGPAVAAQLLICPMLDHRNATTSSRQFSGVPAVWTREFNEFGWQSVLRGLAGGDVPAYVSPALAEDLSGLPPTYVDAGTAEVFRDEDVEYASRIWAAGGQAELHVWAGGFHAFDALLPQAVLSVEARRVRNEWLRRTVVADRVPAASVAG